MGWKSHIPKKVVFGGCLLQMNGLSHSIPEILNRHWASTICFPGLLLSSNDGHSATFLGGGGRGVMFVWLCSKSKTIIPDRNNDVGCALSRWRMCSRGLSLE